MAFHTLIWLSGIQKLLHHLNPRQAAGPDNLSACFLEYAIELAPILVVIFNKSLSQGIVHEDWRHANVTAIFKKGARQDPDNYRPVSLTSMCCNLLAALYRQPYSETPWHSQHSHWLSACVYGQAELWNTEHHSPSWTLLIAGHRYSNSHDHFRFLKSLWSSSHRCLLNPSLRYSG